MQSQAKTPELYLEELLEERKIAFGNYVGSFATIRKRSSSLAFDT